MGGVEVVDCYVNTWLRTISKTCCGDGSSIGLEEEGSSDGKPFGSWSKQLCANLVCTLCTRMLLYGSEKVLSRHIKAETDWDAVQKPNDNL